MYGSYVRRYRALKEYINFVPTQVNYSVYGTKSKIGTVIQDAENEKFINNSYNLFLQFYHKSNYPEPNISKKFVEEYTKNGLKGIEVVALYDLLPQGVNLNMTSDEIKDSFILSRKNSDARIFLQGGQEIDIDEFKNILLDNMSISVDKNWNNTGRTRISIIIDLKENPIYYFSSFDNITSSQSTTFVFHNVNTEISYDDFLTYGNTYVNEIYSEPLYKENRDVVLLYSSGATAGDNPRIVDDDIDVDEDSETLTMTRAGATTTISSVVSTHQDVTKYVETDNSAFTTGEALSSLDTPYRYRLRVRTGENDVTNLVIYDSIEDMAKMPDGTMQKADQGNGSWQGEFLGVDTSPAELKGYNVKVYYNEGNNPGTLKSDNTWKEYTEEIDKSKVKSLAFEYLDSEGQPAILPKNSVTFVHVLMKSPKNKKRYNYTYNGCYTQWNAIDSLTGRPVDFITGINSNIVKVRLEEIEPVVIRKINEEENLLGGVTLRLIGVGLNEVFITDEDLDKEIKLEDGEYELIEEGTVEGYRNLAGSILFTVENGKIISEESDIAYLLGGGIGLVVENHILKEQIDIEVEKKWYGGITRDSVVVSLYDNDTKIKEVELNKNNNWKSEFTDVEKYDINGREITYRVEEEEVEGATVTYKKEGSKFIVENRNDIRIDIPVRKIWEGKELTQEVEVSLYDGSTKVETITLRKDDNWENEFKNIPKYRENNEEIEYSVKEEEIEVEMDEDTHYTNNIEYTKEEDTFIVKNTTTVTKDIEVEKKWVGESLDKVKVYLYKNNQKTDKEIELNKDNGYKNTFTGLDKYDEEGNIIDYSIKEEEIEGYRSEVKDFIITNTKIEEEVPPIEEEPKEEPKEEEPKEEEVPKEVEKAKEEVKEKISRLTNPYTATGNALIYIIALLISITTSIIFPNKILKRD